MSLKGLNLNSRRLRRELSRTVRPTENGQSRLFLASPIGLERRIKITLNSFRVQKLFCTHSLRRLHLRLFIFKHFVLGLNLTTLIARQRCSFHVVIRAKSSVVGQVLGKKKAPAQKNRGLDRMAATYSPTLLCSTIGAGGLNFSVRNGKRWDPAAKTT